MARLSQIQYSVVLYLINCAASKLSEVITTDVELSSLIGYDEKEVRKAIDQLATRNIIKVKYGTPHLNPDKDSLRIGLQFDVSGWILDFQNDVTAKDAIVFPFRRSGQSHLQILPPREEPFKSEKSNATWKRILEAFAKEKDIDESDALLNEVAAKMLVETHPVDQVLLMIRHFASRIPTLSLLASSWQHFQELFEEETQKIDILDARQKHLELDEKLRNAAVALLHDEKLAKEFSEEERTVLDILAKHRHPRRQLFWAYQTRSRYPNLVAFFSENSSLMLAVTTGGKVLPRKD